MNVKLGVGLIKDKTFFLKRLNTFSISLLNRVGCVVTWVTWVRGLRGSKFYMGCVGYVGQSIFYVGCVGEIYFCVGQIFFPWVQSFLRESLRGSQFFAWV